MNRSAGIAWSAVVVLFTASGAQCHRREVDTFASYGPRVLMQNPSLGDVIQVVNDNSAKVRSLFTTDATMTVPGAPSLRASIALERQKRVRLRAGTGITGDELDLGSNDELFWFWIRRNPPPTVYFCRHDQFAQSAAKQFVPIEPQWLLDAAGLASFDPAGQHSPPQRTAAGRLEIRSLIAGPNGNMTKATIVDEARGWVVEQQLFDDRGTLVAVATANRHWRDPASGAVVPTEIEIRSPANQFSLKIEVKQWTVNSFPVDPAPLFTMLQVPGWHTVDLADPNLRMPMSTISPPAAGGWNSGSPAVGNAPNMTPTPVGGATSNWTPVGANSLMGPMFSPPTAASNAPAAAGQRY